MMNNNSSDLNGSNMYDLWVIKSITKSVRVDLIIWQNICNSDDMKNLPSLINQVTTNYTGTKKLIRQRIAWLLS